MNKNRKLDVFVIMLVIVDIFIVKHFYQTEEYFILEVYSGVFMNL